MRPVIKKWINYQKQVRQGKVDDEYYTRYVDVEKMLSEFDLTDKIVYCPCDTEKSAFVRYFSLPGKCKELIYTSDDFHNHADLFEKCDIVVTNPPFSQYVDFWSYIRGDYILVVPILPYVKIQTEKVPGCKFFDAVYQFDRPDGSVKCVRCQWFSNIGSTTHPDGYSFQELYNKPIPLRENPVPMRNKKVRLTKRMRDLIDFEFPEYINVYGKRSGYPLNEKLFVITADTLCREFIYHAINCCDVMGGCLVSLNPKYV